MEKEASLVMDDQKVKHKLDRIAREIHERYFDKEAIVIVGVADRGFQLAQFIATLLEEISELRIETLSIHVNKDDPLSQEPELSVKNTVLDGRPVLLVDDVLNSGRTLIHAARSILRRPVDSLTTAALVDRKHRSYPIKADFVGLSLATTMKQHIAVKMEGGKMDVYLD